MTTPFEPSRPHTTDLLIAVILILGVVLGISLYANFQAYSELAHPTLVIWTISQTIGPSGLVHGVPDTFDYYIRYTSDVPVAVAIVNTNQFAQYANCPHPDVLTKLTCVTGSYASYPAITAQDQTFTLAEGCGAYIAIYYSSTAGTFHPNISIKYNPANGLTGICQSAA